jgi:hypothetical protein
MPPRKSVGQTENLFDGFKFWLHFVLRQLTAGARHCSGGRDHLFILTVVSPSAH